MHGRDFRSQERDERIDAAPLDRPSPEPQIRPASVPSSRLA
jgi:hypothetical protein